MTDREFLERPNHVFISYSGDDGAAAEKLHSFLTRAGFNVWFDRKRLQTAGNVIDDLVRQVGQSRSLVLILTASSLEKAYVKEEMAAAYRQAAETDEKFKVVVLRTDTKLDPRDRFPASATRSWLDADPSNLTVAAARQLLLALTPPVRRAKCVRHAFVSCGWGIQDQAMSLKICAELGRLGVRMVGDAPDQSSFGEDGKDRVRHIMSGCTGHLMILPARRSPAKTPEQHYKYFLAEMEVGRSLGLARTVLCADRTTLPAPLQAEAIEVGDVGDPSVVRQALTEFHDDLHPSEPHAFFACDLKYSEVRNNAAHDIIEHVLGMECWVARDYLGENLDDHIFDRIIGSNLFIADLASTCTPELELKDGRKIRPTLKPNMNTCVEAGIAKGARRRVFVTSLDPATFDPTVEKKSHQVPWTFRTNQQINWYQDDVDFLAMIHRIALGNRRRIINEELPAA